MFKMQNRHANLHKLERSIGDNPKTWNPNCGNQKPETVVIEIENDNRKEVPSSLWAWKVVCLLNIDSTNEKYTSEQKPFQVQAYEPSQMLCDREILERIENRLIQKREEKCVSMYVCVIGHSPLGLFRTNINKQG